jgi:hypothetical protein
MILNRRVLVLFVLTFGATGLLAAKASGEPLGQHQGFVQDRGAWDAPPQEWKEIQRRGFQDGIEGARRDYGNNRRPDVNNREEYRRPSLPYELREPYREGFRRGYERGMDHLIGRDRAPMREPERPVHPPERDHDRGHDLDAERGNDMQRLGFQDGMEGARKDLGNNRRPDVNNREEYRRPRVSYEMQRDYREGFRRGYDRTIAQMTGRR